MIVYEAEYSAGDAEEGQQDPQSGDNVPEGSEPAVSDGEMLPDILQLLEDLGLSVSRRSGSAEQLFDGDLEEVPPCGSKCLRLALRSRFPIWRSSAGIRGAGRRIPPVYIPFVSSGFSGYCSAFGITS